MKVKHLSAESIALDVDETIIDLLKRQGKQVSKDNKESYSRSFSLIAMGLDSLQLLELGFRLSEKYLIDLEPAYFFQYGTPEAIIRFIVEKKLELFKDWLYEIEWKSLPTSTPSSFISDQLWVILEQDEEFSKRLKKQLEKNYQNCVTVKQGEKYAKLDEQTFVVNPNVQQDFVRLFREIPHITKLAGVIDLWGYRGVQEDLTLEGIEEYLKRHCVGLINLANALASSRLPAYSRLWVVNTSIATDGNENSLVQSSYSALCKVIFEEYPKSKCTHLALEVAQTVAENVQILCAELNGLSFESQIAWRNGKRLVARILPSKIKTVPRPVFSDDASYLVGGGLSPLGLQVARWYVEHGAKNIVLLDEIQITPEIETEINLIKSTNTNIKFFITSFDNMASLKELFASIKNLKGVIHVAGVVEQDLLMHVTWDRFKNPNRLKIAGSWNLHQLTKNSKLDHFLLFSTCLTDIAPGGRASYLVANTFLDALAHYRRNLGLPSLSIDWGPWELGKISIRRMTDNKLSSRVEMLYTDEAFKILDHIFYFDKPQIIAAQLKWESIFLHATTTNPLFKEIAPFDDLIMEKMTQYLRTLLSAGGSRTGGVKLEAIHHKSLPLPVERISQTGRNRFNLSPAQKRVWFVYQLNNQDTSYNLSVHARVKGEIVLPTLQRAFDALIERHAILRTTYDYSEREVLQVVQKPYSIPLEVVDLSGFSEEQKKERLAELDWPGEPFDLANGAVIRAKLFWLSKPDSVILLLEAHHICCDASSLQKLIDEWIFYYEKFLSDSKTELPDLKIEYVDYAHWLLMEQRTAEYQNSLLYWKAQLQDAPRMIHLTTDYPRQQIDSYQGAKLNLELESGLRQRIEVFAKTHQITPFAVLLTVFSMVLQKYSCDEEVNIGIPFLRRPLVETENIVGFFTNTLVTKHTFVESKTFTDLLKDTTELIRNAFSNQSAPFEEVIDALNVERDLAIHPLFQTGFDFLPGFYKKTKTEHLEVEVIGINTGYPNYDLFLEMIGTESSYHLGVKFNEKIFKKETINRFVNHFQGLITQVLDDPLIQMSEISLLTPAERTLILDTWNDTVRDFPLEKRAIDLFEEQVDDQPDALAVAFQDVALSYGELNASANQLAHYLLKYNIKSDDIVGICLPRSHEMIIAMLAVMKAGAAFVPLDPGVPSQRLAYMVDDTQLKCLITVEELSARFPDYHGPTAILDSKTAELEKESTKNLGKLSNAHNLAFVIYTSGSTGDPKGVMLENRGLTNELFSESEAFGLEKSDVLLSITTFSFDMAIGEICQVLITGATVVIAPEEARQNVFALQELIRKHQVTVLQATPTTWTMMFESGWKGKKGLKALSSAEALKVDLAKLLCRSCKGLWNGYGPTETTIGSSTIKIEESDDMITIGRPYPNTSYYILDSNLLPVPIGVPGTLYIGGAGVSRGYLKQPALTREKFVPSPFPDSYKRGIYNTGDIARFLPDGRVVYMGRSDNQVKVRGYRLELGDIEAKLTQMSGVLDSAVVVRDDLGGSGVAERGLVAYLIPENKERVPFNEFDKQHLFLNKVKTNLREELPAYMIPAAYVLLEAFPTTPSGKIDRKKLPKPEIMEQQYGEKENLSAQFEAVAVDGRMAVVTSYVSDTVRSVLEFPESQTIDEKKGFFDMGFDSISILELKNKLQMGLGTSATIATTAVFHHASVEKMTQYLGQLLKIEGMQMREREQPAMNIHSDEPIAIIGMACRFPKGANTLDAFWGLLDRGGDGIVEVPASRWNAEQYYDPDPAAPGKMITKMGGFLDGDITLFDAAFFRISPREAEYMDPQQRLLLEVSHEAIESAGIATSNLEGSLTSVFIGFCSNEYLTLISGSGTETLNSPYITTGNTASIASGRISYVYDLQGPNLAVDTACSSSLVAVDEACKSLRLGESNTALAGGVNLMLLPDASIDFSKAGMLAPDGHCKTFDDKADGYARGEGCGIIVLKRLSDAKRDGDRIFALIKSSGINQDGATSGLTVPNGEAQEVLIRNVLSKAKLQGADIDYVEAHGTGTSLGDPIEVKAIAAAYGQREARNPLKLGSVKTNIGHLEGAAGIAGVIKTVLALQHEVLPAHLHFEKLNPHIEMNFPAEIVTKKQPWKRSARIRRAAVSSFGFSGTNAHLILEEAPLVEPRHVEIEERLLHMLTLSAKTEAALSELVQRYLLFLDQTSLQLSDICFTANTGRNHERYRIAAIAKDVDELKIKLGNGDFAKGEAIDSKPFLFTTANINDLAAAYVKGGKVDWQAFHEPYSREKVSLPTYPFQRSRYWVETAVPILGMSPEKTGPGVKPVNFTTSTHALSEMIKKAKGEEKRNHIYAYTHMLLFKVAKIPVGTIVFDIPISDYGLDSIMLGQVANQLIADFNFDINIADIQQLETFEDLAHLIDQHEKAEKAEGDFDSRDWKILNEPAKVDSYLFVCPPFGFGGFYFQSWIKSLPENIQVHVVGFRFERDWTQTISGLAEEIDKIATDKPFIIYGHSMGGIVAYELTLVLQNEYNKSPLALIISSSDTPPEFAKIKEIAPFNQMAIDVPIEQCRDLLTNIHYLPPAILGLKTNSDAELRGDIEGVLHYQRNNSEPVSCPIMTIHADNDVLIQDETEVTAWQRYTSKFTHLKIQGTHLYFMSPPKTFFEKLAEIIRRGRGTFP
jgi:amino acid adenylation domain-containing protein